MQLCKWFRTNQHEEPVLQKWSPPIAEILQSPERVRDPCCPKKVQTEEYSKMLEELRMSSPTQRCPSFSTGAKTLSHGLIRAEVGENIFWTFDVNYLSSMNEAIFKRQPTAKYPTTVGYFQEERIEGPAFPIIVSLCNTKAISVDSFCFPIVTLNLGRSSVHCEVGNGGLKTPK